MAKYSIADHDKLLFFMVMMFCAMGCSPYRHWNAVGEDENVDEKKRGIIAPVCAKQFPLAISKSDTFFIKGQPIVITDTSGYGSLRYKIDSLNKVAAKDPNCPQINVDSAMKTIIANIKPKTITVHDTLQIKNTARDSALVYALMNTLKQKEIKINDLTTERDDWKEKARKRFWIIFAACTFLAGGIYFRFKTFFITKFATIGRIIANITTFRK